MATSVDKCFPTGPTPPKALYPRLRPGPHGTERDHQQVLSHQRARLHGAMVEAAAQRGYAAVTVHQLVTLAGVSKRSFYEHFASKERCFMATFDAIAAEAFQRMIVAAESTTSWEDRLAAMLSAMLDGVCAHPNHAQLCMLEAFALGADGRRRVTQACASFERALAGDSEQTNSGSQLDSVHKGQDRPVLSPLAVKGVVHGVCHVIRSHLQAGSAPALADLAREILTWARSYASPGGAFLHAVPAMPHRASALRAIDGSDQRHRLQRGALLIVGRKGWLALDRQSLSRMARMEEAALTEIYQDVHECFLEALDMIAVEALAAMLSAARAASAAHESEVPAAMRALTDLLAREPAVSRAVFVESLCAGPPTVKHGTQLLYGFAGLLRRSVPGAHELSVPVCQAIVGAVWGTLHDYIAAGATARLPQLADHLSYLVLAPVVGAHAAIEAIGTHPRDSAPDASLDGAGGRDAQRLASFSS